MNTAHRTLVDMATTALRAGSRIAFVDAAASLIAGKAPLGEMWRTIAAALLDFGELHLARLAADSLARSGARTGRFEQATIYARTGKVQEARALVASIAPSVPDIASHAFLVGTLALNDGDLPAASDALLAAARYMPRSGQIWHSLSSTGSMARNTPAREAILAAERSMLSAPDADRATYLYGLGKTHDDLGDYAAAYLAFTKGAAIIAKTRPYVSAQDATDAKAARAWTRSELLALQATPSEGSSRPIFVTGMPRSGSTLVEHILASHSAVSDGEELMRFAMIVREIGGFSLPTVRAWAKRNSMHAAAASYLHLFSERFGNQGRAVDKTLETSRYLGLIAAALPDAPIVWMRRNPADNAWSCFRTYFMAGLGWTFSREAIANHFRLEAQLLRHWQEVLGERLLVVDYEKLVTDKINEIPRLLMHCGLSIEPQVFNPERAKRAVVTSSVAQVRAPINSSSIGVAARYPEFTESFLKEYEAMDNYNN